MSSPEHGLARPGPGAVGVAGQSPGGRLRSVDVLRGASALAVVLVHVVHHRGDGAIGPRLMFGLILDLGNFGVPMFIVLSGFCIHLGVARRMALTGEVRADWVSFWRRRFHRLYPPYLAAIALGLASYHLLRTDAVAPFTRISVLPWDLATHLLMVHNLFVPYWAGVGNFPLWTLGMEEQLYALYALYLVLRRRSGAGRVALVTLAVGLAWQGAALWLLPERLGPEPFALGEWLKWPIPSWFNWVLGAIAAEAYVGALALPRWCRDGRLSALLLVVGVGTSSMILGRFAGAHAVTRAVGTSGVWPVTLRLAQLGSQPATALAFFVMLNCCVRSELAGGFRGPVVDVFARIGLFSYSLYLTHVPVLSLAESLAGLDTSLAAVALRYAVFVPTCLAAGWLFFLAVESRFLNRPVPARGLRAPAGAGRRG